MSQERIELGRKYNQDDYIRQASYGVLMISHRGEFFYELMLGASNPLVLCGGIWNEIVFNTR